MIIVKLTGGLGNQMFQYAAARRLAQVNAVSLKIEQDWFSSVADLDTPRKYELNVFGIQDDFAAQEEVKRFKTDKSTFFKSLFRKKEPPSYGKTWIRERHFHFDPAVLNLQDNVYLDGYWQSYKYFIDIEDTIRSEFTVSDEPDKTNRDFAESIMSTEAVSIHVRREDYITNPITSLYHGVCTLDYYRASTELLSARLQNPHFFVFSDDLAWVRENLVIGSPVTYVDCNGSDKAYEDLRLMSLCRHHIIANSSFSWWGAWLGSHPSKVVIAPMRWFKDENINTSDLLPETWIRM
jgi:hypothetical protein